MLVVDAATRGAIATCWALGKSGYRVGTASSQRLAPAEWSRYSERRFKLPDPRATPREFAATAADIVARHRYETVLSCSEDSLWALSTFREAFPPDFALGLPGPGVVAACMSKLRLLELAPQAGLGVPETVVCKDRDEAVAAAARLGFPVLVKPRSTVFEDGGEVNHQAAGVANDHEGLDDRLDAVGWPCLVQRRETGPTVSFAGVAASGELLGVVYSRFDRTWPSAGGSTCFSRSLAPPASLVEPVLRLIELFDWEGIFQLDLIEAAPDRFLAIDFNPRIYASIALAVKAGVPQPSVWCDLLFKGVRSNPRASTGFAFRWPEGDLRVAGERARQHEYRAAAAVLLPRRRVANAYFRCDDPMPMIVRGLDLATALGRGSRAFGDET